MSPMPDPHGEVEAANQLNQSLIGAREVGLDQAMGKSSHVKVVEKSDNLAHGVEVSDGYGGGFYTTVADGNRIATGEDTKANVIYRYEGQLYDDVHDAKGNLHNDAKNHPIASRGEFQGRDEGEPVIVQRKAVNGKTGDTEIGAVTRLTGERAEKARAIMNRRAARAILNAVDARKENVA